MKTQSNNLLQPLSNIDVKNLATQVQEKLITTFNSTVGKTFGTADLWNIQRNYRTVMSRRRFV